MDRITDVLRLHLGGRDVKPGWQIFDIRPGEGVDHVGNIEDLTRFADACCDEVYASHVLEHVPQACIVATLRGMHRILKPAGRLLLSVPDLEALCSLFLNQQLDKAARLHVMRIMFGGQMDPHDFHYVGFSLEILLDYLGAAGFSRAERVGGFGLFNDASSYAPYGVPISLNVIAYK